MKVYMASTFTMNTSCMSKHCGDSDDDNVDSGNSSRSSPIIIRCRKPAIASSKMLMNGNRSNEMSESDEETVDVETVDVESVKDDMKPVEHEENKMIETSDSDSEIPSSIKKVEKILDGARKPLFEARKVLSEVRQMLDKCEVETEAEEDNKENVPPNKYATPKRRLPAPIPHMSKRRGHLPVECKVPLRYREDSHEERLIDDADNGRCKDLLVSFKYVLITYIYKLHE